MSKTINIMLCTNNPDNGMDTGRCSAVTIDGDESINLECQYADWSPRCYVKDRRLHFSRRRFACSNPQSWVGNWCWNAVEMTPHETLLLLRYLRELGWTVDKAESRFFDLWRTNRTIRHSDLMTAIFDAPTAREKAGVPA